MWISVLGAVLQLGTLVFSHVPGGERLSEKTKFQHRIAIISFGFIACIVSIVGIQQSNRVRERQEVEAARQLAMATAREQEAVKREKEMQERLIQMRTDIISIGAGLGNQQAAMLAICPAPLSILNGSEHGSDVTAYKILQYNKVDLWFHYPSGRYSHAKVGEKTITSKNAVELNGCLANVLHLPKPALPPPLPDDDKAKTPETTGGDDTGAGGFFFFLAIVGILWAIFSKKKEK